jgi:hypothetical protein
MRNKKNIMMEIKTKTEKPVEGPSAGSMASGEGGKPIDLSKESIKTSEGLKSEGAKEHGVPSPSKDMLG